MAEGGDSQENNPKKYQNNSRSDEKPLYLQNEINNEQSENIPTTNSTSQRPDLCQENTKNGCERNQTNHSETIQINPFSFKHFLNCDVVQQNYQHQGARPKVFTSQTRQHSLPSGCSDDFTRASSLASASSSSGEPIRMASVDHIRADYSSILPDFVQDHLVLDTVNDNLPNSPSGRRRRGRNRVDFPLDLPLNGDLDSSTTHSCPSSSATAGGDVGVSKSLPDFLSDGPIHSSRQELNEIVNSCDAPGAAGGLDDNQLLREQVQVLQNQLAERNARIQSLELEIVGIKRNERNYVDALAKSMEEVEGNISSNSARAASADSCISKLKLEIKKLKMELNRLRQENTRLRGDRNSKGLSSAASVGIADELRTAANTAEQSLRHLLAGLNNLRHLANEMENINHPVVEETSSCDLVSDDETGPAL